MQVRAEILLFWHDWHKLSALCTSVRLYLYDSCGVHSEDASRTNFCWFDFAYTCADPEAHIRLLHLCVIALLWYDEIPSKVR